MGAGSSNLRARQRAHNNYMAQRKRNQNNLKNLEAELRNMPLNARYISKVSNTKRKIMALEKKIHGLI
jgi:hypothetical protein